MDWWVSIIDLPNWAIQRMVFVRSTWAIWQTNQSWRRGLLAGGWSWMVVAGWLVTFCEWGHFLNVLVVWMVDCPFCVSCLNGRLSFLWLIGSFACFLYFSLHLMAQVVFLMNPNRIDKSFRPSQWTFFGLSALLTPDAEICAKLNEHSNRKTLHYPQAFKLLEGGAPKP